MIDTNALRKKVLDLAIRGKLVLQDPSDEPASVLLERIREEKQRLIKEGKIKKDKVDSVIFKGDDNCYYEKIGKEIVCIDEELRNFEFPQSWSICRLITIADIYNGNSINETEKKKNYTGLSEGYNYIGTKDISFEHIVDYENGVKIPFGCDKFRIAYKDSPLLCIEGGSAGRKIAILEEDVCFGNKLCAFRSFGIVPKFLYYYLQSPLFVGIFKSKTTGVIGGVSINTIKELFFAVPPLEEQKRIVSYIEDIFCIIDLVEKNQNDYMNLVEILKKAILQSAIQGKLVEQDESDESASVLLERIRAEKKTQLGKKHVESYIFKGDDNRYYEKVGTKEPILLENLPFEIPSSWSWARISHIAQLVSGKPYQEVEDGYLYVKVSDMNLPENFTHIKKSTHFCNANENDLLKIPCIIFPKRGGAIATNKKRIVENIKICIDLNTMALIPDDARFIDYLYRWFSLIDLYSFSDGSSIPQINNSDIYPLLIPIPPYNEQIRICNRVKQIFDNIKDEV